MGVKRTRRAPARRKKQSRRVIPKLLLLLSYSAVLIALGSIFFMKAELRRFGVLGGENAAEKLPAGQTQQTSVNKRNTETTTASASKAGEITVEEKKQLEDILRSRNSE